ncbi:TetR/AcrR family transcriptional regulator [Mycobacterium sp. IDR2000157661]|uniref:TetR/AcrR family transcriptional regulator n=1 Tax=Mycobacterium sp. IDR2000157661 TaxID=2867005 RepID=UPI001EEADCB9|nr:TetR/AcrR family transcriptional regulator [Mycobacterium sp. IDR2000157661]ULE34422.1 TetR/AcrR family transcriptional regulator [Mycobacterium sp. IDR2000157661]
MTTGRRGRPRSTEAHDAILDATRAILVENGYSEVSMDRVAIRAGVGKQTLYRRWPSKAPLVAEAVIDAYQAGGGLALPDTGDLAADLKAWLNGHANALATGQHSALIRALAAAAAEDGGDGELLYRQLTGPQHDAVLQRLRHCAQAGRIRADADLAAVADAIIGTILYRELTRPGASPRSAPFSPFDGLVDVLIGGLCGGSSTA